MAGKSYRELISEKDFLDVQRRSQQLGGTTINDITYGYSNLTNSEVFTLDYTTIGLTDSYQQYIIPIDITPEVVVSTSASELIKLLRSSMLRVYCDCPAFLYWGFEYIAWSEDYGIEQETRYPEVRNPNLDGNICKHLYNLLANAYAFGVDNIARELRAYTAVFLNLSRHVNPLTAKSFISQVEENISSKLSNLIS